MVRYIHIVLVADLYDEVLGLDDWKRRHRVGNNDRMDWIRLNSVALKQIFASNKTFLSRSFGLR